MSTRQLPVVLVLGTTQTLAWASSYYLIAILADPIARDLNTSSTVVFAAFSAALLISAMLGPRVGRTIDLIGGRGVLAVSNVAFAAGLVLLSVANSQALLWLAWLAFGVAWVSDSTTPRSPRSAGSMGTAPDRRSRGLR